jgi:hypothetical protein
LQNTDAVMDTDQLDQLGVSIAMVIPALAVQPIYLTRFPVRRSRSIAPLSNARYQPADQRHRFRRS